MFTPPRPAATPPKEGNSFEHLYNSNGQLLNESIYASNGTLTQSRDTIWLGNKPIAQIRTTGSASTVYYILSDHLNTPRKVTSASGMVLWSWNSDAFGTTPANPDVDGDGSDFEFNLRFPGQYFDKESGQHYNYFRDYEPGTGRYLESDPIGLEGGWNTFMYANSNTISYGDKDGRHPISPNTGFSPYGFRWHTNCVSGHRHYSGRGGVIKTESCSDSEDTFEYSSYSASATDNCVNCKIKCLVTFAFGEARDSAIEHRVQKQILKGATDFAKRGVKFIWKRIAWPFTVIDGIKAYKCWGECT